MKIRKEQVSEVSTTSAVFVLALTIFSLVPTAEATHELPDPVAWWRLDEVAGSTVFVDSIGTNTGSCTGTACPTMGVPGRLQTAGVFDGLNDLVSVNHASILNLNGDFTISFWSSQGSQANSFPGVIGKGNGVTGYVLYREGQNQFCLKRANLFVCHSDSNTVDASVRLYSWTFDDVSNEAVAYVDGVQRLVVSSGDATPGLSTIVDWPDIAITNDLTLGRGDSTQFGSYLLDDLRFYDSALDEVEVADLYYDPAHHPCNDNSSAPTGWVSPLILLIAAPLITVAVIIGLGVALTRKFGGFYALLLLPLAGIVQTPTVEASHLCNVGGSALANTLTFIAVPLAFIFAILTLVFFVATGFKSK